MIKKNLRLLADILVMAFAIVFPHFARLPMFIYPAIVLAVIWGYLYFTGRSFGDIGFRFRDISVRAIVIGAVIGIAYALFVYIALGPFILWSTGLPPADLHDFYFIRSDMAAFVSLLLIACLWVIPYEEIVFRGFVLTTLWQRFGSGSSAFWIAGLINSFLFAFYHIQEGYSAVIAIFIGALFTIWLYRVFKGNLWYLIAFHSAYDIVMLNFVRVGLM